MSTDAADALDEFGTFWAWFADTTFRGYSPMYDRICRAIARDREVLAMVHAAPGPAHMPTVLLGAVHYLILGGAGGELADVYAGRSGADPGPLFVAFCKEHRAEIQALLSTRHTQTNEVGRCSGVVPALATAAGRAGQPLALIDVGCSAGLNLFCDRYRIEYRGGGAVGPANAAVQLSCDLRAGSPPMVTPPIAWRAGIDADPVDLTVPENARWLLACVFPDTGRLEHTRAAIAEARADPPRVERGDAIEVLPSLLREVPDGLLACLVTTQAFAYFAVERRSEFVDLLDDESRRRPLSWVSIEAPGVVEALGAVEVPADGNASPSVVGLVRFESGAHAAEVLGLAQSHGAWLDWRAA